MSFETEHCLLGPSVIEPSNTVWLARFPGPCEVQRARRGRGTWYTCGLANNRCRLVSDLRCCRLEVRFWPRADCPLINAECGKRTSRRVSRSAALDPLRI